MERLLWFVCSLSHAHMVGFIDSSIVPSLGLIETEVIILIVDDSLGVLLMDNEGASLVTIDLGKKLMDDQHVNLAQ